MQIEALEIRNYRLFRDAVFSNLPQMTVVVGANGSGKSTLFDVFSFLKESLTQNVAQAMARRGGFKELVSRGERGPIGITIKFRESGGRLATYQLEVALDEGKPVVHREVLKFRRGQYGQPWHFVDFSRGHGTAIKRICVWTGRCKRRTQGPCA
jgi:predicted ATPase